MSDYEIWRTGISQSFACHMQETDINAAFEPSMENDTLNKTQSPICWFDKMLRGGFKVPDTSERPLTILLTGPPGGGKSTFGIELCYRLAKNLIPAQIENATEQVELNSHGSKNCFYLSLETTSTQIHQKALALGWEDPHIFQEYKPTLYETIDRGHVILFGADKKGYELSKAIFQVFKKVIPIIKEAGEVVPGVYMKFGIFVLKIIERLINAISREKVDKGAILQYHKKIPIWTLQLKADVLIVDSLNSLPAEKNRERVFNDLLKKMAKRTRIVVFILDSDPRSTEHKFWEYVCDNVIRMESNYQDGYYLRTLEILKARYQENVSGKQIFKICSAFSKAKVGDLTNVLPRHSHPYRKEGGIFIYPSIHYYLSRYKRQKQDEKEQKYAMMYPKKLNDLINPDRGLIPEGRCTAFLGVRGGHKSHLGYLHLLYRMIEEQESAIVVSLRDDEAMTRQSMCKILLQQHELMEKAYPGARKTKNLPEIAANIIEDLENRGRLEILYYHPGFITPEEFCHRMLVSVKHVKRDGKYLTDHDRLNKPHWEKVSLLFNSLDQLSSRFPLCTKQDIFVPGIIDILNGENVTSLFVAIETPDQPITQYGIHPMADLVLSFKPYWFQFDQYLNFLKNKGVKTTKIKEKRIHEAIVLQVMRFAGGEMAGAKGILELVPSDQSELYTIYDKKMGLHFTPLPRDWRPQEENAKVKIVPS